jgi:phosphatidylglycerophosphate synthase
MIQRTRVELYLTDITRIRAQMEGDAIDMAANAAEDRTRFTQAVAAIVSCERLLLKTALNIEATELGVISSTALTDKAAVEARRDAIP